MKPRIGFLGTGWIGRHRMEKIVETGAVDVAAVCDPVQDCAEQALTLAPHAVQTACLREMLKLGLDGVVIATPNALHARQSIEALEAGAAVFCQKPLARNAAETQSVIETARRADRLLGVDLSYRHTAGMQRIAELIRSGALGRIFAIDLTFHNAYGPDKGWFYDPALSGGGCLIDLGVHLVDLALWSLDFPPAIVIAAALFADGEPIVTGGVEDYASAHLRAGDADVRLACSWRLHAGQDAVIAADFYGTAGGAMLRNIGGSFYDFTARHLEGTSAITLAEGPDEWGGRAAAAWARQLAASSRFNPSAEQFLRSAEVLDRIYRC